MKFVLNTSFDPHFCALFDDKNNLVAESHWMIPREDGRHIWNFLATHLPADHKLSFIGGVTGPGSFSSLRTAGAVLNALSFKFKLPVHQARADKIILDYLQTENQSTPFLLNSFGQRIFTLEKNILVPQDLSQNTLDSNTPYITTWLPESKADYFKNQIQVDALGPQKTILNTLQKQPSQPAFVPDYEYPAVQS